MTNELDEDAATDFLEQWDETVIVDEQDDSTTLEYPAGTNSEDILAAWYRTTKTIRTAQ